MNFLEEKPQGETDSTISSVVIEASDVSEAVLDLSDLVIWERKQGTHKTVHCTGTPSFKAPCVLRKQLELLSLTLCISLRTFLVVLKTSPLKIT